MTFAVPRVYVKDSPNTGFGAIGGLLEGELDGYYYGHIHQIEAGEAVTPADANTTGVCDTFLHCYSPRSTTVPALLFAPFSYSSCYNGGVSDYRCVLPCTHIYIVKIWKFCSN